MNNFSTTQATNIAAFASIIVLIAKLFKFEVSQEDAIALLSAGVALIAVIMNFVNRYKKGDLTLGGFKK